MDRLIDRGIITLVAIPALSVFGYRTVLFLAINAPPGMVDTLAEQFASAKSINHLMITSGRYDIVGMALCKGPKEYLTSFAEELGDVPGNIRIETMLSVEFLNKHSLAAALAASPLSAVLAELDCRAIRGLEKSPRVSMTELAGKIGASVSSVRSSFHKLTSQGVIRVVASPNPVAFGHLVMTVTLVEVNLSSLKTTLDRLRTHPSVRQVSLALGPFNRIVWSSFENSTQMHEFLDKDLGTMPGVIDFENLIGLRLQKRLFNLEKQEEMP